jgi:hypothetical protein
LRCSCACGKARPCGPKIGDCLRVIEQLHHQYQSSLACAVL